MPRRAGGVEKMALSPAMRRSQATAIWTPPPKQVPSMAAMTGLWLEAMAVSALVGLSVWCSSSSPEMSAPAQNMPPSPVSTVERMVSSASISLMTAGIWRHMSSVIALRLPGLLMVTTAMSPSRVRSMLPMCPFLACRWQR